ncbi:MAG: hypothetical protein ABUK15_07370 [Anaerolineales bacterium]
MPIASRFLQFYRPQVSGRARVREVHVDSLGNQITRQYMTTKTQIEVEADMNARDQTETLQERDFDEVLRWVLDGNDPNTFDYTGRDVVKNKAEERVVRTFARQRGDAVIGLAWWIAGLGTPRWNAITTRLGWDSVRSDRVKLRAANLFAVAVDIVNGEEDV